MSIMGRLAAGLGAGAATLGQKYIDEEIAQQRAQFLADLQRTTASKIRDDEFAFQTDPTKAEARRAVKAGDIVAEGEAKTKADLARAQNTDLAAAEAARGSILKKAEAQATIDVQKAAGNDPAYIKALRAISAANAAPDRTDYKGRELDNAIKQIAVDNARTITKLKGEFASATPERKQEINEELSVLTGKDADKFLPVPLKDEMGAITGYKVFDTKRGVWAERGASGGAPAVGTEVGGYVFNGGDPNDKKNWTAKAAGKQAGYKPLGGAADKPGMSPGAERGARKPVAPTGPVAVAESQLRQATERLNSYGSRQRQRDPDGFRQAQAQVAEARAALAAAQESEAGPVTDSDRRPSTRYAAP